MEAAEQAGKGELEGTGPLLSTAAAVVVLRTGGKPTAAHGTTGAVGGEAGAAQDSGVVEELSAALEIAADEIYRMKEEVAAANEAVRGHDVAWGLV